MPEPEPPLIRVAEVGSTNDELIALAHAGAANGTAFAASRQTAGRGRRGHAWQDLSGRQVFLSVLHCSRLAPMALSGLTLDIGSAVADVVRKLGLSATLKWPNDVLLDGKKVGGILSEMLDLPTGHAVVVGLGLNVQAVAIPASLPAATTLAAALEADVELDLTTLIVDLTRAIRSACSAYEQRGRPDVAAWAERSDNIGRRARHAAQTGTISGIDPDGALRIRWDDTNENERFGAGVLEILQAEVE